MRPYRFGEFLQLRISQCPAGFHFDDDHFVEIRVDATTAVAVARIGPLEQALQPPVPLDPGEGVIARIETAPSATRGPDDVILSIRQGGREQPLGTLDGRYLSTEVAGGFTGRVVGFRAVEGRFLLEHVRYISLGERRTGAV